MDKSWMYRSRVSSAYLKGVEEFLDFAFSKSSVKDQIICPCVKCGNGMWVTRHDAKEHLICDGFIKGYTKWIAHGEALSFSTPPSHAHTSNVCDDMQGLLHDRFGIFCGDEFGGGTVEVEMEGPNAEAEKFYKLVKDADKELYPDCKKFSKLSFRIRLFHIKCLGKMSEKAFTMLLDLLNEAFPEGVSLPKSFYETKKVIKELGLSYEKIDACANDCMLYWKENATKTECDVCHASRWIANENEPAGESTTSKKGKKIAAKVLRHFPLKPRLQQLFMSSKTASFMRWHEEERTKDGCMRHPANFPAWKTFDFQNQDFAKDPRNVRLGLACDGFNPFRTMSVAHSTWPVVLMPYNLPPWMCMKQPYFMLSLLIPGPSAPGNNIDVYLQPLIEELKELWEDGVDTYDASTKQNFQMRAALLWTISDFPAYANLSGWSTKREFACPSCHEHTCSRWLSHGGKFCYKAHRRFLDENHVFRKDKRSFDGTEEDRMPPPRLTGAKVLDRLKGFDIKFGKLVKDNLELSFNWKKKEHIL